ncbi:hypothetical protein [Microbacterium sp. T32]|uniref:hypothetical protein n=1 Tax=Microbacterium sp. T32 TaxID=1776083 RepID=UPI0007AB5BAC|nr:hypothetical protein [Microbacterium sp. T32]KZE41377.1 hypothetical protein AVW09_01975 [Microbacterium sp. T32]
MTMTTAAPTVTAAPAIVIPLTADLTAAFRAVLPFTSKDDVTPIIGAVKVTHRYLIATDRYAIARYEHTTYDESVERHGEEGPSEPDFAVLIPRDVAEWIGKHKPTSGQTLTVTAETVTIGWTDSIESSRVLVPVGGNYPPVERLITDASAEDVEISPFAIGTDRLDQLVKAGKALARVVGKNAGWRFQLPASTGTRKCPPIRATLGERMVTMIQPMLNVR